MRQGDPLDMIAYCIVIIPLINNLKHKIPDITHNLYADNTIALVTFKRIETYFNYLTFQGPRYGYYPEPSKSVLTVNPENIEA